MIKARLNRYTPEFRAEAVKLVLEQGMVLQEAAKRLSLPKGTLANWLTAARGTSKPKAPPGSRTVAELEAEVARLQKDLVETRLERDVIKKAAAYFAQGSLASTRK